MAFHKKLNPESENNNFGISKIDSGCCGETGGECGYKATITGAPFLDVTFVDSKGVTQTATFATPATNAATLEEQLRIILLAPEPNPSDPNNATAINGMGTLEKETGGITAVDNGADVDLEIITDVVITQVNGVAMVQDCTTDVVCTCQIDIAVGADVSAVDLVYDGGAAQNLATGTYNTGDGATLQTEMSTAANAAGANVQSVVVTEDLDSATFVVKVEHAGQCNLLTWNGVASINCGCEKKYHV